MVIEKWHHSKNTRKANAGLLPWQNAKPRANFLIRTVDVVGASEIHQPLQNDWSCDRHRMEEGST